MIEVQHNGIENSAVRDEPTSLGTIFRGMGQELETVKNIDLGGEKLHELH